MKRIRQLFGGLEPRHLYATLFVVLFALAGTYYIYASHASGTATLSLSPASGSISLGSTFTVTIQENSGTTPVNAVEADLTYDQTKLQYVSTSTTTSAFPLIASNSGGSGTVQFAGGTSTPVTGTQTVAVVSFTAISTGSTAVQFAASSGIAQSSDNTNVLGTTTGATYTVADTTAPSVPTGLTGSNQTATSLTVSWTASTDNVGVTGYKVYRNGTQVGTSTTTSFNDSGLSPSNTYSYTVAAYDAAGNTSAQSTSASIATTADTTAPSVPTGLTASTRNLTSIVLKWTASTDNVGVAGYKVYRGGTQVGTTATATYTDSGLTPGTSYSYTVAAYDAAGNVSAQTTALATSTIADTTAPSVPTGLSSPSQTTTSITISWTASTDNVGVTGYKIYRGSTQVGTSTTTSYTDSGLSSGVAYSYTVAAYDAAGNVSAQSTASSFTTTLIPGDANHDGVVNYLDLSALSASWQSTTNLAADFNHDGIVNYLDLSILAANWGK